jgi:dolichyl-phosphate beta-glucosyltransferase
MDQLLVSIVIPAYNEEARIGATLDRIGQYFATSALTGEVLVINDGSRDQTAAVVTQSRAGNLAVQLIEMPINQGKGAAVKIGMMAARGEYVFFYDADGSTPIEELDKALPLLQGEWDVVIGSRAVDGADIPVRQPWYREGMGKIFNKIVKLIALADFYDTQCGFKGFRRSVIPTVFSRQTIERWGFDVEILFIAKKHGCRIKEMPVRWLNSPQTKINVYRDSWNMFLEVLSVRLKSMKGLYR